MNLSRLPAGNKQTPSDVQCVANDVVTAQIDIHTAGTALTYLKLMPDKHSADP